MANLVHRNSSFAAFPEMTESAPHNNSLQQAFDPPPIFAAAKTVVASNAAELRRYADARVLTVAQFLRA